MDAFGNRGHGGVGEFEQCAGDCGQGGEGVAHAAEFAWVAHAVLQAAEDALDVANALEVFLQFSRESRATDKFGHTILAAVNFY